MVELFYHVVSTFQEQQENWVGKVLLLVGNVKLEGRDMAACVNLMSCLGKEKTCQALIEAFVVQLNLEASTAFKSGADYMVEARTRELLQNSMGEAVICLLQHGACVLLVSTEAELEVLGFLTKKGWSLVLSWYPETKEGLGAGEDTVRSCGTPSSTSLWLALLKEGTARSFKGCGSSGLTRRF